MRLGARAQQCPHVTTATMTCKRHVRGWGGWVGGSKVMISLHQQQMWQILTSSHSSLLPCLNFLLCIDCGFEGEVMSSLEQSRICYFKAFPCVKLQIFRNVENFQKVTLNKASNNTQEFEYLKRNETRKSVIVITLNKCEFSQRFS
jgi:hypothetical protein